MDLCQASVDIQSSAAQNGAVLSSPTVIDGARPVTLPPSDELAGLRFDNTFVDQLPADLNPRRAPHAVHNACFSRVLPDPVRAPALVAHASEVAALLEISEVACASDSFAQLFGGNALLSAMDPYAACYGGHQFGSWAGQLGDGRAITLGEVVNASGERWELQLKGAGLTPYSRTADGRAVLRSSIREFLCSEAMHHLGVPTTRALSLVTTGDEVVRDIMYDGHPRAEPGAIVTRVAPSFVRFGNFEIFTARDDQTVLRRLADYTIRTHFPALWPGGGGGGDSHSAQTYAAFFTEVCRRTAVLMAHWMRLGFVHGVMNTDNMSILGLTIDYGPFGFLDSFDADFTPNTTDAGQGRYRFANQPRIARWNLLKLAEALYPLILDANLLQEGLAVYARTYEAEESRMLAQKLGLSAFDSSDGPDGDRALVNEMFEVLSLAETDMALFFRGLADIPVASPVASSPSAPAQSRTTAFDNDLLLAPLASSLYVPEAVSAAARERTVAWLRRYAARVRADGTADGTRKQRMNAVNPKYLLRNWLAQTVIDSAEQGDAGPVRKLLDVLRHPYDEHPGEERFAEKRPDWARDRVGCSMLSCSS